MKPFKVRLKQYSPLIHFQPDQTDAGPRATELKPKLDRYLRKRLKLKEDAKIRYSLRLLPRGELEEYALDDRKNFGSLYFGEMGQDKQPGAKPKKALFYHNGAELTVNPYFDPELAKAIQECLPVCLALENFGTRQNKGFGSFYPEGGGFPSMEESLKRSKRPVYYFGVKSPKDIFPGIETLYKAMKTGINETGFGEKNPNAYLKSLLWRYFNQDKKPSQRIPWEKRFMKQALMGNAPSDGQYLRALLGLAEEYSFRRTRQPARMDPDYDDHGSFVLKSDAKFQVDHPQITRFKSPITFKPAGKRVYLILDPDSYQEGRERIPGARFGFHCGRIHEKLKVPDQFDLEGFMDFVAQTVNQRAYGRFEGKSARTLKGISIQKL